jgi:C4-dicarboxylate-specific signal transduction histidine kinase
MGSRLDILLIEDNVSLSQNVAEFLEGRGHRLDFAFDGPSGLRQALAGGHDVIVLDLALPRLDGLDLCRALRARSDRHVPVIMITARDTLDDKLRAIARDAMASVVYVINTEGIAVAASNAGEPISFVGSDYRFRHYFTAAMANGAATQYALGTVSVRPGLYLSSRVDGQEGPLGVVVVKVELDRVEANWRESGFIVFATDDRNVVLSTSVPQWRFGALSPLSEEAANAARDLLQLPDATFAPLPLSRRGDNLVTASPAGVPAGFVAVSQYLSKAVPDWRLSLLIPADAEISAAAMTARVMTLLALVLLGFLVFVIARRRRAVRQRSRWRVGRPRRTCPRRSAGSAHRSAGVRHLRRPV